jgi:hypothetical protein
VLGDRLIGKHPSLDQLQDGDLQFHIDFRAIYPPLLEVARLAGRRYSAFASVRSAAYDFPRGALRNLRAGCQ